jgi:hypothetical protein
MEASVQIRARQFYPSDKKVDRPKNPIWNLEERKIFTHAWN